MAAIARSVRPAMRLLNKKPLATMSAVRSFADGQMPLTFAAANQVFYDNVSVKQLDVPSFSGTFGILPNHVPTLAVLRTGVVTVFENDGTVKKIFVSSGSVTINEDSSVQVLVEEACPVEHIDAAGARDVLSRAQSEAAQATTDVARAEAAIAVEVGEALVSAAQ